MNPDEVGGDLAHTFGCLFSLRIFRGVWPKNGLFLSMPPFLDTIRALRVPSSWNRMLVYSSAMRRSLNPFFPLGSCQTAVCGCKSIDRNASFDIRSVHMA
jgi:hypothetical protein